MSQGIQKDVKREVWETSLLNLHRIKMPKEQGNGERITKLLSHYEGRNSLVKYKKLEYSVTGATNNLNTFQINIHVWEINNQSTV
jgi:hypothetical protein